jgi:hypothetical protein
MRTDNTAKSVRPLFRIHLLRQRRMPAVRAFSFSSPGKKKWWIPAARKTMAVSLLWRDGITGTRDEGMNECLHRYFLRPKKAWTVTGSTVPRFLRQRRMMIQQINPTYLMAGFTLCMDDRIAKMDLPDGETAEAQRHQDEKALLAVMTSFCHRRAWTLLEGHKPSEKWFYRE